MKDEGGRMKTHLTHSFEPCEGYAVTGIAASFAMQKRPGNKSTSEPSQGYASTLRSISEFFLPSYFCLLP